MKIAVNTRLLLKGKMEGIGWVAYETLKRITRQHPEHQFYFIFDRPYHEDFVFTENVTPVVAFPQARHPFLYLWWFELSLPRILKEIDADVFFSPDGYLSLKTPVPSVCVFHDLNFEHRPKDIKRTDRWFYKRYFPKFAKKAKRIITVSDYTKEDVIARFAVDGQKVSRVYNGANEMFKAISKDRQNQIRERYTKQHPYFIFIGAFNPRKNLVNLFGAFDLFKRKDNQNTRLVVVGEKMYWTKEIEQAFHQMQYKEDVVFTGRLSMDELVEVLGAALAMTYVSYLEGFGIPIVEAFKAEVPVITSNITSMPEIAGDAALLVDPYDKNSIANAMIKISADIDLRNDLVAKGRKRGLKFSWDESARQTWKVIEEVLQESIK